MGGVSGGCGSSCVAMSSMSSAVSTRRREGGTLDKGLRKVFGIADDVLEDPEVGDLRQGHLCAQTHAHASPCLRRWTAD